jgi:hypothetical protein
MPSSGMLCSVALIRINVSEERITSIIRVTRISEIGTLAVTSNWSMLCVSFLVTANVIRSSLIPVTLMMETLRSSKMSVLTRATRYNIPEDGMLQLKCSFQCHAVNKLLYI